MMRAYSGPPRRVTEEGRVALAAAVSIDWDWDLPASSYDLLREALSAMGKDDLEGATRLVNSLSQVVNVLLMERDAEERKGAGA